MTAPLVGQISPADVAAFLTAKGFTTAVSYNGHLPPAPDPLVVIAPTGGPSFSVEQAFDNVSFQIRTRGKQSDDAGAWQLAWDVDYALIPPPLAAPAFPAMVGTQFVVKVSRVGGPPAFLLRDSGRRANYTGNYIFQVARA